MTKRLLAALLCAILVMALLPATALAEKYNGWDNSQTYIDGDIITIGGTNYTYKGDLSTATTTIDLSGFLPTYSEHIVFKAGSGKVLWVPEKKDGAVADGTLTLSNAEINMSEPSVSAFKLPSNATIVLLGENIISGDRTYAFKGDEKFGTITITGAGTIDTTNGCTLISVGGGAIKLIDGERWGTMPANVSVELKNVTVPENKTLDLSECATTTNAGTIVNNGKLVLKQTAATSTDIAAIKALDPTGSGMVKVGDNYYTNKGETIHKYVSLDFDNWVYTKDAETAKIDLTHNLNDHGYEIGGDKESGYIITLGNLLIEPNGEIEPNAIILPDNGNVTVRLKDGATTRITTPNGSGINCDDASNGAITIADTGKLEIQASTGKGAISVPRLIIEGGDITINNNSENGYGIDAHSGPSGGTDRTVNITGGRLRITAKNAAIAARGGIIIGSGMHITSPSGATPGSYAYEDTAVSGSRFEYITILIKESVDGKTVDKVVTSVTIEPAPSSGGGGGGDDTPSPVTVYNDPSQPKATVSLSGNGLSSSDLLITERDPQGSAYKALLKLADSDDVFNTYNIYLRSGKKSTGSAMNLTFDLNAQYAGNDFTLVHQKANNTFEYFYDTANANGDLTFGPLYELSPFMLVKGRLAQTAFTSLTDAPKTGDSAQTVLYTGAALIMAAALAGLALRKQKRN